MTNVHVTKFLIIFNRSLSHRYQLPSQVSFILFSDSILERGRGSFVFGRLPLAEGSALGR